MRKFILSIFVVLAMVSSVCAGVMDDNTVLNSYRNAEDNAHVVRLMRDGVVDAFVDQSGINTSSSTNESFGGTPLLLHFDGADAATSTTNDGSNTGTIMFYGDAQLDIAQSKFGGSSLLLDGTGDYLSMPDSDDWDMHWECYR